MEAFPLSPLELEGWEQAVGVLTEQLPLADHCIGCETQTSAASPGVLRHLPAGQCQFAGCGAQSLL